MGQDAESEGERAEEVMVQEDLVCGACEDDRYLESDGPGGYSVRSPGPRNSHSGPEGSARADPLAAQVVVHGMYVAGMDLGRQDRTVRGDGAEDDTISCDYGRSLPQGEPEGQRGGAREISGRSVVPHETFAYRDEVRERVLCIGVKGRRKH